MRNVRYHPDPLTHGSTGRARFNVLLTEDRWQGPDHWSRLLPRLMEPLGVVSYKVRCGEEAVEVAQQVAIHAAVVDLATPRTPRSPRTPRPPRPLHTPDLSRPTQPDQIDPDADAETDPDSDEPAPNDPAGVPGGLWLLELFKRLPNHPPVVIVRSRTITARDVNRLLHDALKLGAFTVMENPGLEQLLSVFQRMLDRLYRGQWPEL